MTQIGDICGSKICARVHVNLTNKHEQNNKPNVAYNIPRGRSRMYVVVNKRQDLEHAEALKAMREKGMVFLAGVPESTCLGTARRANEVYTRSTIYIN